MTDEKWPTCVTRYHVSLAEHIALLRMNARLQGQKIICDAIVVRFYELT